jgi:hypothetical protein
MDVIERVDLSLLVESMRELDQPSIIVIESKPSLWREMVKRRGAGSPQGQTMPGARKYFSMGTVKDANDEENFEYYQRPDVQQQLQEMWALKKSMLRHE